MNMWMDKQTHTQNDNNFVYQINISYTVNQIYR